MQNELDSSTENTALKETIVGRIASEGVISFREFMALALYHPSLGYYSSWRGKMGRDGDYLTSPEVSPVFGLLIGRQLQEMWAEMGRPPRFQVVEVGAGTGAFCHDLLRWTRRSAPDLFRAIDYVIVEVSTPLVERQRMSVEGEPAVGERVRWLRVERWIRWGSLGRDRLWHQGERGPGAGAAQWWEGRGG